MLDFSKLNTGWYKTQDDNFKYIYITDDVTPSSSDKIIVNCALTIQGKAKIISSSALSDGWHFELETKSLGTVSYLNNDVLPNILTPDLVKLYQDPIELCKLVVLVLICRYAKRSNNLKVSKSTCLKDIFEEKTLGITQIIYDYFEVPCDKYLTDPTSINIMNFINYLVCILHL